MRESEGTFDTRGVPFLYFTAHSPRLRGLVRDAEYSEKALEWLKGIRSRQVRKIGK
jgi:hypothetical protein